MNLPGFLAYGFTDSNPQTERIEMEDKEKQLIREMAEVADEALRLTLRLEELKKRFSQLGDEVDRRRQWRDIDRATAQARTAVARR